MIQPPMVLARRWAVLIVASLIGMAECARLARSRLIDAGRGAWPRLTRR